MKHLKQTFIFLALAAMVGCGSVTMSMRPGPEFYDSQKITVQCQHADNQNLANELENRLAEKGFTIITLQQREREEFLHIS